MRPVCVSGVTRFGMTGAVVGLVCLTGLLAAAPPPPKQAIQLRVPSSSVSTDRLAHAPGILIEPTAPIVNLFERAQEGINRRDWKFALDSLQRIIDDPQGSLLPRDMGGERAFTLFESARRRAVRQVADLPPQGLTAYRQLHDGQAKGMLRRAQDGHDEALLRLVAERYLLTRYGDDAVDLLASWLLDAGRPGEVVSLLTDLIELVPDSDVPESFVVAKLAAARAELGQVAFAKTIVADYRSRADAVPSWFDRVDDVITSGSEAAGPGLSPSEAAASVDWSWPMRGGSLTRQGLMPAISPTVTDSPPWSHRLPGRASTVWDRVHDAEAGERLQLPTPGFVVAGDKLIVRQPGGCVALDMEDLSPIWTYPDPSSMGVDAAMAVGQTGSPDAREPFSHYPAGSISVSHGLAFIIERSGVGKLPPGYDEDAATIVQSRSALNQNSRENGRIIAIDVNTGEAVWERGRTRLIDDPLGRASVRSAPVAVGDELWATYINQRDLYVAVLDPTNGATIDTIALCAMPNAGPDAGLSLDLAQADGLVYVPTEYGVLFAIDVDDHTVRWAVRYGDGPAQAPMLTRVQRRNFGQANQPVTLATRDATRVWLSSPPVVAGGLVLLAATDQSELLAFSAAFGTSVWSASSDGASYVIGADGRYVWLGGRTVSCLSLVDGSVVWTTPLDETPSGRAVISGDAIHVPTSAGLITLHAATGELSGRQLLVNANAPLGNLLCTDAALLSIEPSSVRKFPDTGGPFLAALEAFRRKPGSVIPTLRLAWMQHLRGDSDAALQTLSTIQEDKLRGDSRRLSAVARLQVEALLTLAQSESGESALTHLATARDVALTPTDRLRSRLARAEQLVSMGRAAEAYEALLDTAFTPEAAHRVKVTSRVTASARLQIASRLAVISKSLDDSDAIRISRDLRRRVTQASADLASELSWREARTFLSVLADLPVSVSLRVTALLSLADWEITRFGYERAEQLLLQGFALAEEPPQRAAILMRLGDLTFQPTQDDPVRLGHLLDELETNYAELPLESGSVMASVGDDAKTVGEWVRAVRRKEEAAGSAPVSEAPAVKMAYATPLSWVIQSSRRTNGSIVVPFELVEELRAVLDRRGAPRLVNLRRSTYDGPSDHAFFHAEDDVVFCLRPRDGALLWHTTLRLPESFTTPSGTRTMQDVSGRRQAVADGQIAVFNGRFGMFAVGTRTGRRLWYKPFEFITNASITNIRDAKMDARDGLLAAMPHEGRLTLLRLRDGAELWEHDLRGMPVGRIVLTDRVVATIEGSQRRAQFFQRTDGTLIGRAAFSQSTDGKHVVRVVDVGHWLIGPTISPGAEGEGDDPGIVAFDMHSGKEAWRVALNKPLAQLFDASLGYLGVALMGGDVMVLRANTGEVAFTHRVAGITSVVDGRVIDTNLVVQAHSTQRRGRASELIALDIVTGNEEWRRSDVAGVIDFRKINDRLYVPALIDQVSGQMRGAPRLGGAIIDLHTGLNLGDSANLDANTSNLHRFNGDYGLYDGALLVGFSDGIQAYATEPINPQGSERGF